MAKFELPELPYEYNALEPHISEDTLKFHHDKHHQAYCDKLNAALEENSSNEISEILASVLDKPAIRNNGGGFWNHIFYWESMGPNQGELSKELEEAIIESFGSFDEFKEEFTNSAISLFGSGWTWLAAKDNGKLVIYNTPNQDNYMMDVVKNKEVPILGIDVWEHAYYLDVQNKRPQYIENFFKVVNWTKVSERFSELKNG